MSCACSRKQEIFLLNPKPRFFTSSVVHHLRSKIPKVTFSRRSSITLISLTKNKISSHTLSERIFTHVNRSQPNLRISRHSLITRRTIVRPPVKFFKFLNLLVIHSTLRTQILSSTVNPNVLSKSVVLQCGLKVVVIKVSKVVELT